MSLSFEVNDVCGLAHCELDTDKSLILVGGNNADGKSSLMLALGCCLSRNGNPKKLTRAMLGHYRRNGSSASYARLSVNGGKWGSAEWRADKGINWNEGEDYAECPQTALDVIAGLTPVASLDVKLWKEIFSEVKIPFRPFCEALSRDFDRPLPPDSDYEYTAGNPFVAWAQKIWNQVNDLGVNVVIENYRRERLKFKGIWQDKASGDGRHEEWGDKKSPLWKPAGWQTEWEGRSIESMQQDVVDSQAEVSAASVQGAVDMSRREKLLEESGGTGQVATELADLQREIEREGEKAQKEIDKAVASRDSAQKNWSEAQAKINGYYTKKGAIEGEIDQIRRSHKTLTCPHCKQGLVFDKDVLIKARIDWEERQREGEEKIVAKQRELLELTKTWDKESKSAKNLEAVYKEKNQAQSELTRKWNERRGNYMRCEGVLKERLAQSEKAAAELGKLEAAAESFSEDAGKDLEAAENKLAYAKKALELRRRWGEAMDAANNVEKISMLIGKLEKGHVSEELRRHGMERVRRSAQKVGEALSYEVDLIDGIPVLGGRPMPFCSESEQWILSFVVQRALAYFFKVPVFLIDRFDVLDENRRAHFLVRLASVIGEKRNISVIIAGTTTMSQDMAEKTDIILSKGQQNGEQLSTMGTPKKGD